MMKRKLYYTIEKDMDYSIAGDPFLTGVKTIVAYEILKQGDQGHAPVAMFDLEVSLEDNSKEEMQNWLDDNGYGDKDFEFIQL